MRTSGIAVALVLLSIASSTALAALPPEYRSARDPLVKGTSGMGHGSTIAAGGETFADATPIGALPYNDVGNTCTARNDYPFPCVFDGGAPDRVYSIHPLANTCISVSLCDPQTNFDTGLYIYRNTTADLVACVDDYCGLASQLDHVPLTAGSTYYIVVDGYASSCGTYAIAVTECPPPPPPCAVQCPPGGLTEGEPCCFDGYVDTYNAGCNSNPPSFTDIPCDPAGVTMCGTYGTFNDQTFRDTDWYRFTLTERSNVRACATGSQPTILAILDGNPGFGCSNIRPWCGPSFGLPDQEACCTVTLAPGTYWVFVSTSDFGPYPCGSPYQLTLRCSPAGPPQLLAGMYGCDRGGMLFHVDLATGAGTLVGTLPAAGTEIEYDDVARRAWLQGTDGSFYDQEFDITTGAGIGGPISNGASFNGLEFVGLTLYGTAITGPCFTSTLRTLNPVTGASVTIGPTGLGPIAGLAFDIGSGLMYGITGCSNGNSSLVTLDLGTGAASVVGPCGFEAGSLEFGPDGRLYAGGVGPSAGGFYRIDKATGAATFVGPTGFGAVTGLTAIELPVPVRPMSWGALKLRYR